MTEPGAVSFVRRGLSADLRAMSYQYTFPSYAKINWTLEVLGRRPDGYHELHTLFQMVSLCDWLTFEVTHEPDVLLTCNQPDLATDETNLVVRAAKALHGAATEPHGVRIYLEKQIPMGAGLGGGSSNAAVTLLALQKIWNTSLTKAELQSIAEKLGADVPFFLYGGTALGTGRGDVIEPLPDYEVPYLVLANPGIVVPTGEIFRRLASQLTSHKSVRILPACFFPPPHEFLQHLCNDLEKTVFQGYPLVSQVWQVMGDAGAQVARMSGSGATVFGVFENEAAQNVALERLQAHGWHVWTCHTVNRAEYLKAFEF